MKEAAISQDPKMTADISNQIQAQILIDNRNESALKRIKETAEMQDLIYQKKLSQEYTCMLKEIDDARKKGVSPSSSACKL